MPSNLCRPLPQGCVGRPDNQRILPPHGSRFHEFTEGRIDLGHSWHTLFWVLDPPPLSHASLPSPFAVTFLYSALPILALQCPHALGVSIPCPVTQVADGAVSNGNAAPTPGRISVSPSGVKYQDETEWGPMCTDRANNGYNSGMGEIFRKVAAITEIDIPTAPAIESNLAPPNTEGTCEAGEM